MIATLISIFAMILTAVNRIENPKPASIYYGLT